jgi:hypothetical protein
MTQFKHACFISYRNGKSKSGILANTAEQLYEALLDEMGMFDIGDIFDHPIFLDSITLKGAKFLNTAFSEAVYHSCSMIVIFTPNYFSENKPFCTAEFEGMLRREKHFQQVLANKVKVSYIIPIILRKKQDIPLELSQRKYYDFCNFDPDLVQIKTNSKLKDLVREIVIYIDDLVEQLKPESGNLCADFANFKLLDLDIQEDLQKIEEIVSNIKHNAPPFPHQY